MGIILTDTPTRYGLVSVLMHWLIAMTYLGLFCIGWYMMTLDYYNPWYIALPHWHKSIGMLLLVVVLCLGVWRLTVKKPLNLENHLGWEVKSSRIAHWLLGLGVLIVLVSGYLIPTAEGSGISVFNWGTFPAAFSLPGQEDISGLVHRYVAYFILGLSFVHAGAALKHHFVDKDDTLRRMLSISINRNQS
jgi:cytochrome b561